MMKEHYARRPPRRARLERALCWTHAAAAVDWPQTSAAKTKMEIRKSHGANKKTKTEIRKTHGATKKRKWASAKRMLLQNQNQENENGDPQNAWCHKKTKMGIRKTHAAAKTPQKKTKTGIRKSHAAARARFVSMCR